MKIIRELQEFRNNASNFPRRRLVIVVRDDGFYSYAEQYYFVSCYDGEIISEGWYTHPADGIYATPEIAEIEGRRTFSIGEE